MNELELDRTYHRGDKGRDVRRIQEWLSLGGYRVQLDGDFGPATEAALKRFQGATGLTVTGGADAATFERLVAPMKAALAPMAPAGRTLGQMVVAYAQQHLQQHPLEVGGQNRGPWVRLYMDGNEGEPWAWCVGFATYCVRQAADTLGVEMPFPRTFSCDKLASLARERQRFLAEVDLDSARSKLAPGSFFLKRRAPGDWVHSGIVISIEGEVFTTIEGNTNDDGSREGYEVCARVRAYGATDFVLI